MTLEFIAEMSQSIGTFLGRERPVMVGHDVRNSSPSLSKTVASGLLASGISAAEGGLAPTPAHQFAVRTLGYGGGIIVTASHNPPQYNGMKVVGGDGVEIARESEAEIESIYAEKRFVRADWKSVGALSRETRIIENYIRGIISQVNAPKNLGEKVHGGPRRWQRGSSRRRSLPLRAAGLQGHQHQRAGRRQLSRKRAGANADCPKGPLRGREIIRCIFRCCIRRRRG